MGSLERVEHIFSEYLLQGYIVFSYSSQEFSSGGLHFSSDVKEVKVHMKNKNGEELHFQLISKTLPDKVKHTVLNSRLGFIKEAYFYNTLIPEYDKILKDHNLTILEIFPKCYFASKSEIVLSDLRQFNFVVCKDRLDKNHTILVLNELAKFHSTGVYLKLCNPDIFKTKLESISIPALQNANNPNAKDIDSKFRFEISELLKSMKGFEKYANLVEKLLREIDETKLPIASEPYATILHNDLWNGNILFKYSSNKEPLEVKFIDFQTTIYNSPARDLIYFLFTSVNIGLLKEEFSDLIQFYHCSFTHNLSLLGVDIVKFSYQEFVKEINIYGPTKLKHIIKLLKARSLNGIHAFSYEVELQRIIMLFHERKWL